MTIMNSKKTRLLARKHLVVRVITETQNDYRWWRYQASEPECGYVVDTTTYSVPAYPRPEKPKTRKEPRMRLSRRQLRKRLYGAGYRGDKFKAVFAEIVGFKAQNLELASQGNEQAILASQGLLYPFDWNMPSIREKLGNRGRKVLAKGMRPLMIVVDEWAYYATQGMADFLEKARSIAGKSGDLVRVTQSLPASVAAV